MTPIATTFLIVRHGETHWNVAGRLQGHLDSPLTPVGRAQADAVAQRLAAERLDALYTSDLGRARDTAAPIERATGRTALREPGVRERCYGIFESLTWGEIEAQYPREFARLASRDPAYGVPEGESALAFRDRVLAALAGIAARHPGERVGVVTHGGVLGALYRVATGLAFDAPRDYALANAGLNRFAWRDASLVLEAWGDVSHLAVAREAGVDVRDNI
jgi:probable phosphoglycerate mutase